MEVEVLAIPNLTKSTYKVLWEEEYPEELLPIIANFLKKVSPSDYHDHQSITGMWVEAANAHEGSVTKHKEFVPTFKKVLEKLGAKKRFVTEASTYLKSLIEMRDDLLANI